MKKAPLLFSRNHVARQFRFVCLALFLCLLVLACHKNDPGEQPVNQGSLPSADSLSNRLLFSNATKKQGTSPRGGGGSLKISFEDTLYLTDELLRPIKFLHLDTTQNVAGVFIQVQAVTNSGPLDAHEYYDVPELPQADSSDTTSVILVGIDPTDLKPPVTFNVAITPYNSSGQPIATTIKPVKISEHKTGPSGKSGDCGLVLPDDEFWDWDMSYASHLINGNEDFIAAPDIVFGASGQFVGGSCCNGISIYGLCPGERKPNRSLHFATYYRIMSESLTFHNDGTFFRQSIEDGANPIPDSSDFCAGGEGRVRYHLNQTIYNGTYTVSRVTLPQDLQMWKAYDSLQVRLNTTSSTPQPGGFGNGGGVIHQLDCEHGSLVLMRIDPEGFGQHLFRFYSRRSFKNPGRWYPF